MIRTATVLRGIAVLLAMALFVIAGLLAWFVMSTTSSPLTEVKPFEEKVIVPPSGTIYFSDYEVATGRALASKYLVAESRIERLTQDPDAYVVQVVPKRSGQASLFSGAYMEREEGDRRSPVTDEKTLSIDDIEVSLAGYWYPGDIKWSEAAQAFVFTALSQSVADAIEAEEIDSITALNQVTNWSMYLVSRAGEITELTQGMSPQFSIDGGTVYFLGTDGIYQHDIASGLTERITRTPRLPTPASGLSYVPQSNTFYFLSITELFDTAALFELQFDASAAEFRLTRTLHLPAQRYNQFTMSPDGNFAGLVQYQFAEEGGSAEFKIVDLQTVVDGVGVEPRTLFSVAGLARYYHFLSPTWIQK